MWVPLWIFGLLACVGTSEPSPRETEHVSGPNVLILMWDTARADRMSLYGHDRSTTPALDSWASQARVFDRAISPGMWTVPAHGALFTGLPVASHGANARWIWLDERFVTAAEHFGSQGWSTWAWSSNPYLSDASNLLQGFETRASSWLPPHAEAAGTATTDKLIDDDRSSEISPGWKPTGHGRGWPEHLTAYKDGGTAITAAFEGWLEERPSEQPFFAYINFLEAHHPRVPSLESRQAILPPQLMQAGLETDASLFRTMSSMEGKVQFSDEELSAIRGVYDASLLDLDRSTDAVMSLLRRHDLLDNTIIVVVSDHGEHLGEGGMFDHRWSVEQPLLHVPLVIRAPGLKPGRVSAPVSTQALFPTLCSLADVPCPDGLPLPSLTEATPPRVFSELIAPTPRLPFVRDAYPDLDPTRWARRFHVVVEGQDKLIRSSDLEHRLVRIGPEVDEVHNRFESEAERGNRLIEAARVWQSGLVPYDPRFRSKTDRPRNALNASDPTRRQLELLGYTSGDDP